MTPRPALTISIPTYNRPKQLRCTVEKLLPQLHDDCELRIYDNCSTTPVAEVLADLLQSFPSVRFSVIRNAVNVGMLGNIIRCMEDCATPWLVMCGDDDPPKPDFVAKTKHAIEKYPDAIFISFAFAAQKRLAEFSTRGLGEFVRANWAFGDPLSISADAFRMDALKPFMATAYMYAYTLAPHLAIVLAALRSTGGECAFVADQLADPSEDTSLESWSRIWYPSIVLLLELIPGGSERDAFSKKLVHYMSTQSYLARTLITNSLETGADNSFLFRSRMKLRSILLSSPVIFIKEKIFTFLIRNPGIGVKLLTMLQRREHFSGFDASTKNVFGRV